MNTENNRQASMNLTAAISMGVGAMVGAGIFALMGEAGAQAGNLVYISFIVAGLISLLSGYSYAKLGVRYPSSGGIVEYLAQAYGSGYTTGILSIILYFSITIVMAMVARAFGSYSAALFSCDTAGPCVNVMASLIVVILTTINFMGSDVVGKVEKFIVIAKVVILAAFIIISSAYINPSFLSASVHHSSLLSVLGTVAICLLAYHGFAVITNTVEDMPNPAKTLPRALYGAIGIVILIYVGAAFAVFGSLPLAEIISAKDYAMAEAAKPVFGQAGFTIIAFTALLSAASSINANLYSTANMTLLLARDGELPAIEGKKLWGAGSLGLLSTTFIILLITNFMDLSGIASLGSIVYLIVYSAVHWGHLKNLIAETKASRVIIGLALITNLIILIIFLLQIIKHNPFVIYVLTGFIGFSVLIEIYMQKVRKRTIRTMAEYRV